MSTPSEGRPITVSRSDLRAELAEMELRLYTRIDDALRHKADATVVLPLLTRLDALERGDMPPSLARAVDERIKSADTVRVEAGWTRHQRIAMLVGTCVMACGLLVSAISLTVTVLGVHHS